MAKLRRSVALLLTAALLCLTLSACNPYGDYPELIVGTWDNNSVEGRTERFVFGADGTGHYSLITAGGEVVGYDFEYTLEENNLKLSTASGANSAAHTVEIEGNTMVLRQGKSEQEFARNVD